MMSTAPATASAAPKNEAGVSVRQAGFGRRTVKASRSRGKHALQIGLPLGVAPLPLAPLREQDPAQHEAPTRQEHRAYPLVEEDHAHADDVGRVGRLHHRQPRGPQPTQGPEDHRVGDGDPQPPARDEPPPIEVRAGGVEPQPEQGHGQQQQQRRRDVLEEVDALRRVGLGASKEDDARRAQQRRGEGTYLPQQGAFHGSGPRGRFVRRLALGFVGGRRRRVRAHHGADPRAPARRAPRRLPTFRRRSSSGPIRSAWGSHNYDEEHETPPDEMTRGELVDIREHLMSLRRRSFRALTKGQVEANEAFVLPAFARSVPTPPCEGPGWRRRIGGSARTTRGTCSSGTTTVTSTRTRW